MSQFTHTFGSYFLLEGRLAGFELKDNGEPRALRLVTSEGELTIKLKSDLRHQLSTSLVAGDWIQVLGQKKFKPKTGETQLKAKLVKTTAPSRLAAPATPVAPANPSKSLHLGLSKIRLLQERGASGDSSHRVSFSPTGFRRSHPGQKKQDV
ncbi:hypothetical protein QPK87_02930 [Kamptonema cortianum]|nr:hypothetical protein [Kamptonema cortianum]